MTQKTEKNFFCLTALGEVFQANLEEIFQKSHYTLLYFYPKDNTPGCTLENRDFTCLKGDFLDLGVQLIGVSKDSLEDHKKFMQGFNLENILLSDEDLYLHKALGAYGEKNNYGKIIQGVIRSSFLFDSKGNLLKSWKNVKAAGHAQKVLSETKKYFNI